MFYALFILFAAAINIAYFEHDVIVHAKMFIYIHILFLFSIHGISIIIIIIFFHNDQMSICYPADQ
jgi:hypothetical protein